MATFAVGIDLGTTNSVVAYVPLDDANATIQLLALPQLVDAGSVESRTSLPSFLYLHRDDEDATSLSVPGIETPGYTAGELARKQSARNPHRTVAGAKSWLSHSKVDRRGAILPWNAPSDEVGRISPVEASRRYLAYVRDVWNAAFPEAPLDEQKVVLTVPASFDASARELTREAAHQAGLPAEFVLLEEPQAAIYAWLADVGDGWRKRLHVGDTLLVCDVGGGTTDLTLVGVSQQQGNLALERQAVGNHVLVGGDNMDLALAHSLVEQFAARGVSLDPWQSVSLWHACRGAKEVLLGDSPPESAPVTILGRGRKLIGGTVSLEVTGQHARQILLEGFFPNCQAHEAPLRRRASGFQELGLPYENDPAVTRHLAGFLTAHGGDAPVRPTHVLFNGGVFRASAFRQRLLDVLGGWFPEHRVEPLDGREDLDHAVARGAAYYGALVCGGRGVRIRGGTARSYYVGIETAGLAIPGAPRPLNALCVVPFGMEEGTEIDVPSGEFGLIVGEPAQFRLFSSAVRKEDPAGTMLTHVDPDELEETAPVETTLEKSPTLEDDYVPVRFQSRITELGVLELWSVSTRTPDRWKLEFSVREDQE